MKALPRWMTFSVKLREEISRIFLSCMEGYIVLLLVLAFRFYSFIKEDVQLDNVVLFTNPIVSVVKRISCTQVNSNPVDCLLLLHCCLFSL